MKTGLIAVMAAGLLLGAYASSGPSVQLAEASADERSPLSRAADLEARMVRGSELDRVMDKAVLGGRSVPSPSRN